ncbi:M55 family metallopeptidase, partial [bacterium]|nr:M55 family metallopeptidase [candidate division CSSED10-310 bacterium]
HAKSGTPNATLKHTMSLRIADVKINGISVAEAGFNAFIAGYYGVPVVFLSGDKAICQYAVKTWPEIETVAVKEGLGKACISVHPEKSKTMIKSGVIAGLKKRDKISPYCFKPPITMDIAYRDESLAYRAAWYPKVKRLDDHTVRFRSKNTIDCLRFFYFCT